MSQQSELATRIDKLPPNILFGTSSWNYEGWKGVVYHKDYSSEAKFKSESLTEYCNYPLFRTVGIDSSFYGPPALSTLRRYASQVPDEFRWVSKVWEDITIPRYATHKRYGDKAGKENPNFLNSDIFCKQLLSRFEEPDIRKHTGPLVFQFQSIAKSVMTREVFFERLDAFLSKLPAEYQYATEIRNRDYLVPDYFKILNAHRVTHCFNHWSYMPALSEQMKCAADAGGLDAEFFVARLLTPRGMKYQEAVKKFSPYDKLVQPIPEMRADVVRLASRAVNVKKKAFILVNNRLEGHAPGTIAALIDMIVDALT